MCLSILVVGFHLSLMACFTYDREADRISLGCCFAARCAAPLAILRTWSGGGLGDLVRWVSTMRFRERLEGLTATAL